MVLSVPVWDVGLGHLDQSIKGHLWQRAWATAESKCLRDQTPWSTCGKVTSRKLACPSGAGSTWSACKANLLSLHFWCTFPRCLLLCPCLCLTVCVYYSQFSSVAQLCLTLRPHGLQHARLPCPSPTPGAFSNSCPLSQWCHQTISYVYFSHI